MKKLLLLLLFLLITNTSCATDSNSIKTDIDYVTVIRVIDGDTIQVIDESNTK